jgi:hypothetical protein
MGSVEGSELKSMREGEGWNKSVAQCIYSLSLSLYISDHILPNKEYNCYF